MPNDDDPAIGAYEALAKREYLERAAGYLKGSTAFVRCSRRLLFDLVERTGVRTLHLDSRIDESVEDPFLAIVVLDETVRAEVGVQPAGQPEQLDNSSLILRPGVYLRSDLGHPLFGQIRLRAAGDRAATLAVLTTSTLDDSPATAWSIDIGALSQDVVNKIKPYRRPEHIWVSASPEANVPIEAAMHILGAAAARQTAEHPDGESAPDIPVLLDILGPQPVRLLWSGGRFVHADTTGDPFVLGPATNPIEHVRCFVGNPQDPTHRPPAMKDRCFDRVVHLTTQLPAVLPAEAASLLHPGLLQQDGESTFCSFIASVLTDYEPKPTYPIGLCCKDEFKELPLPSGAAGEKPTRPYRDSCTLRVDTARLRGAWKAWVPDGHDGFPPFIDVAAKKKAMRDETGRRWARAVVNRRVGFALSGGGASAYRAGPLLQRIDTAGIPIDVFTSLSGGALIGAFYCGFVPPPWGLPPNGFEFAKLLGPFFQATMPGVIFWTWPYEAVVDTLLGGRRVEDLEIRFAPVAVALPDTTVPYAAVVVKGTLGEAARVSGALPPSFAPATKNWIRYTDGGAGTLVPARVARDCGADVVLACNAIPGPARGNPYSYFGPVAGLLRWMPWVGRWVDNYTWYAFLVCQSSREYGGQADVFVEFLPQPFPMIESTLFVAAHCIVKEAEKEGPTLDGKVNDLRRAWLNLQPPPPPPPPTAPRQPPAPPGAAPRGGNGPSRRKGST